MAKWFPYGVKEPSVIPEVANQILKEFFGIVRELDIPACLAYGLCLGFVRDDGYIPGDNDLDVVVVTENPSLYDDDHTDRLNLAKALEKHGFTVGKMYGPPSNNMHFHKEHILVDVFFRKPGVHYADFTTAWHDGELYPVPSPVRGYLEAIYTNWKKPSNEAGKCGV